jgi:hypothetical protein
MDPPTLADLITEAEVLALSLHAFADQMLEELDAARKSSAELTQIGKGAREAIAQAYKNSLKERSTQV